MLELKVTGIEPITPRIRRIELAAANGGELPAFTAGAHIDIELGMGEARSYSLLNDPSDRHRYVLGVLREAAGNGGSAWMHDVLKVGDVLQCSEPTNDFPLYEAGEANILVAGGIGITPIMCMARRLKGLGRNYVLHYCARSEAEAAFLGELQAEHGPLLRVHLDGGDPAKGLDVESLMKERPAGGHLYVCGPAGLIRALREAGKDWPKGTIHYELFKGAEEDVAPRSGDAAFDIVLKKSGKTLTVPADRSILDVLKDNGVRVKTLCRGGTCGTCRVDYLSGKVDHRDDVLDDDEREEALQVCVSRAMPGEVLVLDL